MKIKLRGHYKRVKIAKDFWIRVATDLNGGLDPIDIAMRYTNPKTGKPYTLRHIYWVIRKLKTIKIND